MPRHCLLRLLSLSCATLVAAASATAASPSGQASPPANVALRDTRWTLATLEGLPLPDAAGHLVLASRSQHLQGHTGCSRVSGRYTQRGTQLALKPVAGTRTDCPEAQAAIEARFLQVLSSIDSYRIEGSVLTLMQADIARATFRASAKR